MFGPARTEQEKKFRLERPFTRQDVQSHFRRESLKCHPDKNPGQYDRAQRLFIKLVETRDFLLNLLEEYGGKLNPPPPTETSSFNLDFLDSVPIEPEKPPTYEPETSSFNLDFLDSVPIEPEKPPTYEPETAPSFNLDFLDSVPIEPEKPPTYEPETAPSFNLDFLDSVPIEPEKPPTYEPETAILFGKNNGRKKLF